MNQKNKATNLNVRLSPPPLHAISPSTSLMLRHHLFGISFFLLNPVFKIDVEEGINSSTRHERNAWCCSAFPSKSFKWVMVNIYRVIYLYFALSDLNISSWVKLIIKHKGKNVLETGCFKMLDAFSVCVKWNGSILCHYTFLFFICMKESWVSERWVHEK